VLLDHISGKEPIHYNLRPNGEYEHTSLIEAAATAGSGMICSSGWTRG
jgi:hypothetical protein